MKIFLLAPIIAGRALLVKGRALGLILLTFLIYYVFVVSGFQNCLFLTILLFCFGLIFSGYRYYTTGECYIIKKLKEIQRMVEIH